MYHYQEIRQEVEGLTTQAKALLDEVALCKEAPTEQQTIDLDWYASKIAKLSYGDNRPEFICNSSDLI